VETLRQMISGDESALTLRDLTAAFEAAKATVGTSGINQPKADIYYYMYTPLRDSRYLTSSGIGAGLNGQAATSEAGQWSFEKRDDGSFDVINRADGSFINPAATYNTQLRTSAAAPAAGWEVKAADAPGYAIITSGTTQLNQTNSSLGYKIYNWGEGTQTTDTGCKYKFAIADRKPSSDLAEATIGANSVSVTAGRGTVNVQGTADTAMIYSPAGNLIATGNGCVTVPAGPAIVVVDSQVFKVIVR
ncbi:MAG: hypothetical protein K2M97_08185, partial [Muribaculaceae bacterium]|nr:hypothetical protein [Muribaculaceae bacterium]